MVDRGGLENRCGCKVTVGSNPTLSAIHLAHGRGGEVTEWSKVHDWKSCVAFIALPWVRIPLSPPCSVGQ